jgi:hypothetical protein
MMCEEVARRGFGTVFGVVDGKRTVVIVQPRFKRLLLEEGGIRAPFTHRQRNNFTK